MLSSERACSRCQCALFKVTMIREDCFELQGVIHMDHGSTTLHPLVSNKHHGSYSLGLLLSVKPKEPVLRTVGDGFNIVEA